MKQNNECHDPRHDLPCGNGCLACVEECDPRYQKLPHPAGCELCLPVPALTERDLGEYLGGRDPREP